MRDLVAETDPFFSFHHVNAFEAPDGKVVVDTCAMMSGIAFDIGFEGASERYYRQPAGRSTLTRLVVDTATRQARPFCPWSRPRGASHNGWASDMRWVFASIRDSGGALVGRRHMCCEPEWGTVCMYMLPVLQCSSVRISLFLQARR